MTCWCDLSAHMVLYRMVSHAFHMKLSNQYPVHLALGNHQSSQSRVFGANGKGGAISSISISIKS